MKVLSIKCKFATEEFLTRFLKSLYVALCCLSSVKHFDGLPSRVEREILNEDLVMSSVNQ